MSPSVPSLPVNATLQTGWQLFSRSFLACLPLALPGVCAGGAPQAFARATGHSHDLQWGLVYGASNAIMLICYGAVILRQHALLTGGDAALARCVRVSLARLPATVLSLLLVLAPLLAPLALMSVTGRVVGGHASLAGAVLARPLVQAGGLLLLLLALGAAHYLLFTWPAVLLERRGPVAALSRSVQLVRGNFWPLAGLVGSAAAGVVVFVILAGVFAGVFMLVAQAGAASAPVYRSPGPRTGAIATVVLSLLLVCPVQYLCAIGVAAFTGLARRARRDQPLAAEHQQG
jgi:hypothetical protein